MNEIGWEGLDWKKGRTEDMVENIGRGGEDLKKKRGRGRIEEEKERRRGGWGGGKRRID